MESTEPICLCDKLACYLILNAGEMPDLGVINGRMKAILFLFQTARSESVGGYEDLAIELLEEVYDIIDNDKDIPVTFQSGLCGIGWMTEHLIQQLYLTVDEDVCEKYDRRIADAFSRREYSGLGLREGLCGFLFYSIARLGEGRVRKGSATIGFHRKFISLVLNELGSQLLVPQLMEERERMPISTTEN